MGLCLSNARTRCCANEPANIQNRRFCRGAHPTWLPYPPPPPSPLAPSPSPSPVAVSPPASPPCDVDHCRGAGGVGSQMCHEEAAVNCCTRDRCSYILDLSPYLQARNMGMCMSAAQTECCANAHPILNSYCRNPYYQTRPTWLPLPPPPSPPPAAPPSPVAASPVAAPPPFQCQRWCSRGRWRNTPWATKCVWWRCGACQQCSNVQEAALEAAENALQPQPKLWL